MTSPLPILFGLLALTVGSCAISARGPWIRTGAFCLCLGLSAALWQVSLGRPRPVLFSAPTGRVVSYSLDEPRAIYLWVMPPGATIPASFELPWSERQASQLQTAAEQAKKAGQPLQAGHAGGSIGSDRLGEDVRFYPQERKPIPPKVISGM